MAGGLRQHQQQHTLSPLVGHEAAASRRRTWRKRQQNLKSSACAGTETSPYECQSSWPWPTGCNRRRLQNRPLKRDEASLAKAGALAAETPLLPSHEETTDAAGDAASAECDKADLCAALDAPAGSAQLSESPQERGRRVTFNLEAVTVHEIPPYAEIYGLHPREFVFDKNYYMIPSVCALASIGLSAVDKVGAEDDDVEDSDSDSENEVWEPWELEDDTEDMYRLAEALD